MSGHSLDAARDRFTEHLRARLFTGAAIRDERSFERPATELVDRGQQELADVCGRALLLWLRLDRLPAAVERLDGEGDDDV